MYWLVWEFALDKTSTFSPRITEDKHFKMMYWTIMNMLVGKGEMVIFSTVNQLTAYLLVFHQVGIGQGWRKRGGAGNVQLPHAHTKERVLVVYPYRSALIRFLAWKLASSGEKEEEANKVENENKKCFHQVLKLKTCKFRRERGRKQR